MFKARWRGEKNRFRAVFKLQFQATQVPLSGWEALMVSLIPADVGKPTARSEKAPVVDGGCCVWEIPIHETVKLSRDSKTGKIADKLYRFVLSANELPKARVLGEATLDFADHADATAKLSTVVLPLKGSNSGTTLHVTVQRIQDDAEARDAEDNGRQRRTLQKQMSNATEEDNFSSADSPRKSTEDGYLSNGQTKLKFHSSRAIVQPVESNGNITKSRSFDATTAIGSNCGSERSTPRNDRSRNGNLSRDSSSFLSPLQNEGTPQKPITNPSGLATINGDNWGSNTDWSLSSAPDESLDGSTNSSEDAGLRDKIQGSDSLEKDRSEIVSLARQVEVSELELQALRKQVVRERRVGEDLSKEVRTLKEERDTLTRKYELLRASQGEGESMRKNGLRPDGAGDFKPLLEELRQELDHEKNLNANLHLQLQKTQESNAELILAVKDLEELLEMRKRETVCAECRQASVKQECTEDVSDVRQAGGFSCPQELEHRDSFGTMSENEELEVLAKERSDVGVSCSFEQRVAALNAEIELYKKDREEIEMQMEQLALDYEILKQENHDISNRLEQSQLREQLRMQYECSAHLSVISDLEAHVENLEKELENQAETFESDLACVSAAKVEQEKRAIRAEEALQNFKWDNAKSLECLQEEFRRISAQMLEAYDEKEKLAMQALEEASQLRMANRHLEVLIEKMNTDLASLKYQHKLQVKELISQIDLKTTEAGELHLKLKHLAEEMDNQRKTAEATQKALSQELSILKSATVMLSKEKSELCEQIGKEQNLLAELKQLQSSINQVDKQLLEKSRERDVLEAELASTKEEAGKSMEELNKMKNLSEARELVINKLNSELCSLKEQYALLKNSQKEDAIISAGMELNTCNKTDPNVNGSVQVAGLANRSERPEGAGEAELDKETSSSTNITGDVVDRANLFSGDNEVGEALTSCSTPVCSRSACASTEPPSKELDILREKNKVMEGELKEMQERYSEISLRFAEVEGERQQLVMRLRSLKNSRKN